MQGKSVKELYEEIQSNSEKLRNCPRHLFLNIDLKEGKSRCSACNGLMKNFEILVYIRGYVAAGGIGADIWRGYEECTLC